MDSLDRTEWDLVIAGTGIQESLLALALSRSNKKILHIDKNEYYGGSDAALSLQDAEDWVKKLDESRTKENFRTQFSKASIESSASKASSGSSLSFSRAYSLNLSPQIIYNQSFLLPALVSSKVDSQLEFLAVGSWWVFESGGEDRVGSLTLVPNGREDLFADQKLDGRSKRGLMKFLRFIADLEENTASWADHSEQPLGDFLSSQFNLSVEVQQPLLALTFSPFGPQKTTVAFSLPRIARHLRSIGLFGPGFGAVFPKWGGMSEIAQVGCRAGAVGGGTYALGKGIEDITLETASTQLKLSLNGNNTIESNFVASSAENLPRTATPNSVSGDEEIIVTRSIAIVSSPLTRLFPAIAGEGPKPACSIVTVPSAVLSQHITDLTDEIPPVYIIIHSSDSGECPTGQCVLYSSVALPVAEGRRLLPVATDLLCKAVEEEQTPEILWNMYYEQSFPKSTQKVEVTKSLRDRLLSFSPSPFDLAFDDAVVEQVRTVWRQVLGETNPDQSFLVFTDRNRTDGDGDDGEEEGV